MKLFYVLLLISCFLLIDCQNNKKKNNKIEVDDDEFAEFDDFFDEDSSVDSNKKASKADNKQQPQQNQQQQQQQKVPSKSDFDEIDITLEDDDEFLSEDANVKPTPKSPTTTTTSKPAASTQATKTNQNQQNLDALDLEEFENFVDDEEFEGFDDKQPSQAGAEDEDNEDDDEASNIKKQNKPKRKTNQTPDLKITNVPEHLIHTNDWRNYYLEIIMMVGLAVYVTNMLIGKTKNSQLANAWFESNRELLEKNFALVGDDGTSTDLVGNDVKLVKESDNIYGIWCSGRQSCLSMLIQLKFLKRQDLISVISRLIKPQNDQIIISVEFERKDIDSYVFCLSNRKQSQNLLKDYQDIATYCAEKKQLTEKYDIDSKYVILNEIGEIPSAVLDNRVCTFLNKYPDLIEYILISDQYVGYKIQQDDQANVQNKPQTANTLNNSSNDLNETTLGLQNSRAMMIICINIPKKNKYSVNVDDIDKLQPALSFAFYLIDKIPRIALSKEAKAKAVKRRKEITEFNMKLVNKQRQEAAQLRKEEKRRAEKEKIMNESDPEKQKKLEEKELKREKKRGQPKLKQIKIKSI